MRFCSALNSASDSRSENCCVGCVGMTTGGTEDVEAVDAAEERRRPPAVLDAALVS